MHHHIVFTAFFALTTALHQTREIYRFPSTSFVENLAVRPSGQLLLTLPTEPSLYLLDPQESSPKPVLIHTFPSHKSLLGITDVGFDTYYVVVTNLTLSTLTQVPKSGDIFRVSFPSDNSRKPHVSLTASLPDSGFLNGLATLNEHTILAADSTKGLVRAINIHTGESKVIIKDPLMAPTVKPSMGTPNNKSNIGVNGIKIYNHTLFFTNYAQDLFASIDISLQDGTPLSSASASAAATIISRAPAGATYDDFAIDSSGTEAFLSTAGGNSVARVGLRGNERGRQTVIAGDINSTEIDEPTSAAFGRGEGEKGTLYVTTAGGNGGKVLGEGLGVVGGQVIAVEGVTG